MITTYQFAGKELELNKPSSKYVKLKSDKNAMWS